MASRVKKKEGIMTCGSRSLNIKVELPEMDRRLKEYSEDGWRVRYILNAVKEMPQVKVWRMCQEDMPIEMHIMYGTKAVCRTQMWKQRASQYGLIAPLDGRHKEIKTIVEDCIDGLAGTLYEDAEQVYSYSLERKYTDVECIEVELIAYYVNVGEVKEKVRRLKLREKIGGKS